MDNESHRSSSGGHRKGTSIYLYNIPECITALFIFVFQRVVVPHLSTTGNTEIGVGKREKGGKAVAAVLVYCSV